MASQVKHEASSPNMLKLSSVDLGIEPNHPQWDAGIACIKIYQAQAVVMSTAQQQEMQEYIRTNAYYKPQFDYATTHRLYKKTMSMLQRNGEDHLSWPIFLILSALYDPLALPTKYVQLVEKVFGTSKIEDHTNEYLAATGTKLELAFHPSNSTQHQ
ncbi:hypothetical protein V8C35DRAFT_331071 [Trichoderma chlorosporum]